MNQMSAQTIMTEIDDWREYGARVPQAVKRVCAELTDAELAVYLAVKLRRSSWGDARPPIPFES